jgi:hypothetical protein
VSAAGRDRDGCAAEAEPDRDRGLADGVADGGGVALAELPVEVPAPAAQLPIVQDRAGVPVAGGNSDR